MGQLKQIIKEVLYEQNVRIALSSKTHKNKSTLHNTRMLTKKLVKEAAGNVGKLIKNPFYDSDGWDPKDPVQAKYLKLEKQKLSGIYSELRKLLRDYDISRPESNVDTDGSSIAIMNEDGDEYEVHNNAKTSELSLFDVEDAKLYSIKSAADAVATIQYLKSKKNK